MDCLVFSGSPGETLAPQLPIGLEPDQAPAARLTAGSRQYSLASITTMTRCVTVGSLGSGE
jgi:hypothetical protein